MVEGGSGEMKGGCGRVLLNERKANRFDSKSFFKCNGIRWSLFSYLHHSLQHLNNYLCALDTTLRILITSYKLHVMKLLSQIKKDLPWLVATLKKKEPTQKILIICKG